MEKQSIRYLQFVLGIMIAVVGTLAAANYLIDPYGIYRDWKPGEIYPASDTYARIHKTERIKRVKPDAIILGSSRTDIGINPRAEFYPGLNVYNAALSGTTIRELRLMLEFAQKVHPLKKAVLALDFIGFNTMKLENRNFDEARVAADALDPVNAFANTYGTLVTLDTLRVALKHLRYIKHPERHSFPEANGHKLHNEAAWRQKKDGVHAHFMRSPNAQILGAKEFSFNYSDAPGDDTFAQYRAILNFCEAHKIDLVIYINPVHRSNLDRIREDGKWEMFEDWKRRVATITRGTPYPLWDFATENSVTSEQLPPPGDKTTQMKYFWDTDHYKDNVGDWIQRKILGLPGDKGPNDFGMKLQ
ncbi:MAG TPA: hypothetical protein VEF76_03155 [Patescibacteria group bacterium]|nr:hypothetical protein [Patescibacteria group bacterium]